MIRGNKNKTKVLSKAPKTFTRGTNKTNKTKEKKTETKGFVRSKKTKKSNGFTRRKKEREMVKIMPEKQLGGFLPFPPLDCKKKGYVVHCHGITWIDLNICHSCDNIKTCNDRKEHLQKLKEQRTAYFEAKSPKETKGDKADKGEN